MNLGKIVLELRKKKNITQEELAAELGVTAAAVSKWENGYTLPDVLMLCALADYFQVTTDELLGRSPKPLCAAIGAESLPLLNKIETFLKQHGFRIRQKTLGDYAQALQIAESDPAVTHLFVSYPGPAPEYAKSKTGIRTVASHAETTESILKGFSVYLNNMSNFDVLVHTDNT